MTTKQGFVVLIRPYATGDITVEESELVIHERPSLAFVIILLRLFTSRW